MAKEIFYAQSFGLQTLIVGGLNGGASYQVIWHHESRHRERYILSLGVSAALLIAWFGTQLRNDAVLLSGTKKNTSQEFSCVILIQTVSHILGVPRSCQADNCH